MRIGFDFDKVFVSYPPLIPDWVIDLFYKKKNRSLSYRIPDLLEQKIRIASHHPLLRQPIKENVEVLTQIAQNKQNEAYLISSRFGFLKNRTQDWLEKYEISKFFKEIYFNFSNQQPHLFKNEIIKKLKIEKYIDDDLDLLMFLAAKNPNIKFYWLSKSYPLQALPKNITQIQNLKEFYEKYLNNTI